jgi:hypothetical protein
MIMQASIRAITAAPYGGRGSEGPRVTSHISHAKRLRGRESLDARISSLGGIKSLDITKYFVLELGQMDSPTTSPGVPPLSEEDRDPSPSYSPLPISGFTVPHAYQSHPLSPLVCDERAIVKLLETLLAKGRVSLREAARRMGTSDQSLRQYLKGRRSKPSLYWFVKLVEACGGRVLVEWPK